MTESGPQGVSRRDVKRAGKRTAWASAGEQEEGILRFLSTRLTSRNQRWVGTQMDGQPVHQFTLNDLSVYEPTAAKAATLTLLADHGIHGATVDIAADTPELAEQGVAMRITIPDYIFKAGRLAGIGGPGGGQLRIHETGNTRGR